MKIIDISSPVSPYMAEYDGRKIVEFEPFGQETKITLINHTGTHVDGPAYFFNDAKTIDQYPLDNFMGTCIVLDLISVTHKITAQDLKKHNINKDQIVLFKTKNSNLSQTIWHENFIYLDPSGAEYLAEKKVKLVGIDYLALETKSDFPAHKILLKQEILIIEGLNLQNVEPGNYNFIFLPVKLIGVDAAFGRAILIEK